MEAGSEEKFDEFLMKNKHDLNCLMDKSKNVRKRTLQKYDRELLSEEDDAILGKFWTDHLVKPLVGIYDDQVEKLRELAISITTQIVNRLALKDDDAQYVITGILARFSKTPFPEPSEEVRIELLELLELVFDKDPAKFEPGLSELGIAMGKVLTDSNPEMKNKAALFVAKMSKILKEKGGPYMKKAVLSLTDNLGHQHSKVRINSLKGLKKVIGSRGAENTLEEALPQLKMTVNDRHHNVRLTAIKAVNYWLRKMDINSIKKFEKDLMLFLLNGASDENDEVRDLSIEVMERHGNDMHEALVKLGEEDGTSDAVMEEETKGEDAKE